MANPKKVEYYTSQKGGQQVLLEGYRYRLNNRRLTCVHWKCVQDSCRGKCTTVGQFVRNQSPHNHPQEDQVALQLANTLRQRVQAETTSVQTIYDEEISRLDRDAAATVKSYHSMRSGLYKQRRKMLQQLPQSRSEVELPDCFKETTDGLPFLCIDDGDDDKILCYATSDRLTLLQQVDALYMDGTFYSCPPLWDQLYVIHGLVGGKMTQLVYCLLPNRQRRTYERLLRLLSDKVQLTTGSPLQPDVIQTDFELAAINAIGTVFPNCNIRGCFFHYTQALWRKVQTLGFSEAYKQDQEVNSWVRKTAALPLLPVASVQDAWIEIMDDAPEIQQKDAFHDYVTSTWVDDNAMFRAGLWNHHETRGPRTNNHLEGWHSHLNKTECLKD